MTFLKELCKEFCNFFYDMTFEKVKVGISHILRLGVEILKKKKKKKIIFFSRSWKSNSDL